VTDLVHFMRMVRVPHIIVLTSGNPSSIVAFVEVSSGSTLSFLDAVVAQR
jgi:hypothetical protein